MSASWSDWDSASEQTPVSSSPAALPLCSAAVPTRRKPRHGGQRGGTLWPSSRFGWTGDQDAAAHCVLHNLRHSLEDYKATKWNWSTRESARVIYSSPLPGLIGEEKLLSFLNSSEFLPILLLQAQCVALQPVRARAKAWNATKHWTWLWNLCWQVTTGHCMAVEQSINWCQFLKSKI